MAKSVVIVEDDAEGVHVMRMALQRCGYDVQAAADGIAGLNLIKKRMPDGVVLDVKIPKMNGYELCTALQGDEKLKNIPIMVITGLLEEHSVSRDLEWRERLGVADFMSKPFEPDDFAERVRKMLE